MEKELLEKTKESLTWKKSYFRLSTLYYAFFSFMFSTYLISEENIVWNVVCGLTALLSGYYCIDSFIKHRKTSKELKGLK